MILLIFLLSFLSAFLIIQGSLEELFVRFETKFETLKDADSIADWLSDSEKHTPKSRYRNVTRTISEPFKIESEIEVAIDKPSLQKLRKRATSLPKELRQAELTGAIEERIEIFEEEERITEQITDFQIRIEEIQSLPIEEQKDLFRSGTIEERRLAGVALGRENFRVLGGLMSGESRRKNMALRAVFL